MNRCLTAILALLALALPVRMGADPVIDRIPGGKSAAGVSSAASQRLATSLGGSLAVSTFAVPASSPSKGDPLDREALKTGAARMLRTGFDAVFPNPTNPAASIRYSLAEPARVRLAIYAVNGELVRVLVNGPQGAGEYGALWDGRNERGLSVSSGIYFARLDAGPRLFTRKLVIAR